MKATRSLEYTWLIAIKIAIALVLCTFVVAPGAAQAQHGDSIRQYIERTEELLLWAQGLVADTESGPARRVLGQAAEMHQRSRALVDRGMMTESLAVARRARDAMWYAVRVARESMGLEERIRIRSERFRDQYGSLLERARDSHNQPALDFLERARQQAARAREIYGQGDFKLAWKLLEQAEDLMRRSARLLAESGGGERLEHELERIRQAIDRARERLGSGATDKQRQMLAEAEEALQRAVQAEEQGQPGRALQMLNLAGNLTRRAGQDAGGVPDDNAIERQLDRFDERAERIGDRVKESGSSQARKIYDRALAQRKRAAETHRGDNPELALRQIRAAHDLLNRAEDLIR